MTSFLIDTLVWTGVLIAFVLLVRRPVGRWLGAPAAYALWALPVARLVLPPIVLPAWLAPSAAPAAASDATLPLGDASAANFAPLDTPVPVVESGMLDTLGAIDWATPLLALWFVGTVLFLVRRYSLYFEMRRELLAGSRPVGEAGRVRLVETAASDGPVAFGVLDKVIALPIGFMASQDRAARDLALAHELAHHRGHDLLSNMLVQPLFAIHWFNPLAALGWKALRRDQEAACDARVMAHQPREQRAAYAAVIAGFATQSKCAPRLALAAPMACPVLGDRSIVQRLRSLSMNDLSVRRRWAGRLLIGAAAIALPLTGSISYAQDEVAPLPPAPVAPPAAPAPPSPIEIVTSEDGKTRIVRIERTVHEGDDENARPGERKRVEKRIIIRNGEEMSAEDRADFERDMKDYRQDMADHAEDMAEHAREMAELQRELAQEQAEIHREVSLAVAEAQVENRVAAHAIARVPRVVSRCRAGQSGVAETVTVNGRQQIYVCNRLVMDEARRGISQARAEISRNPDMSTRERATAMRALDDAERSLRAESRAD